MSRTYQGVKNKARVSTSEDRTYEEDAGRQRARLREQPPQLGLRLAAHAANKLGRRDLNRYISRKETQRNENVREKATTRHNTKEAQRPAAGQRKREKLLTAHCSRHADKLSRAENNSNGAALFGR